MTFLSYSEFGFIFFFFFSRQRFLFSTHFPILKPGGQQSKTYLSSFSSSFSKLQTHSLSLSAFLLVSAVVDTWIVMSRLPLLEKSTNALNWRDWGIIPTKNKAFSLVRNGNLQCHPVVACHFVERAQNWYF